MQKGGQRKVESQKEGFGGAFELWETSRKDRSGLGQYSERKRKRTKKKDQKAGSPELDGVEKSEKGKDKNGNGRQIGLSGRRTRTHTQDHNALSNGTNVRVPRIRGARTAAYDGAYDGCARRARLLRA